MIRPVQKNLYAVIGNPVQHSLSPVMMNAAFKSLQIPAVYVALQVDRLKEDLETLHRAGFEGLSVTLPHKEEALRIVETADETARAIGAVNTLRRTARGWQGWNTDWLGANRALIRVTPLRGRRALVLGAGGAGRAVAFGLAKEGALVTISNRTVDRGKALADSLGCRFVSLAELNRAGAGLDFEIVVQCTSVGLMGSALTSLVSDSFFKPSMVVMDTVYRPLWTEFSSKARMAGARVIPGWEMLLHQGVAQLERWLDREIPEEGGIQAMRDVLRRSLGG
ncbi:MAG: shikimate dehydrogenase [Syntrophobacteraceae bacterium]|nr:shikimate dehydrogenase [Syntrophobacteraceae bacterium]